jgi:hypothetical protein
MDRDDEIGIVEGDHHAAPRPGDKPTVARVPGLIEIFSELFSHNGFRFLSGAIYPTQLVLRVMTEPHPRLRT